MNVSYFHPVLIILFAISASASFESSESIKLFEVPKPTDTPWILTEAPVILTEAPVATMRPIIPSAIQWIANMIIHNQDSIEPHQWPKRQADPSEVPENPESETPEPAEAPETESEAPETELEAPENESEAPETESEAPETESEAPQTESEASEVSEAPEPWKGAESFYFLDGRAVPSDIQSFKLPAADTQLIKTTAKEALRRILGIVLEALSMVALIVLVMVAGIHRKKLSRKFSFV